ncbi:MAG TPA: hydroxymethylbilane synthase [Alphaproteobacteria bacterium]|nr:hydroxymethylbilane synthase [Alphaproteobacteria bacterium]
MAKTPVLRIGSRGSPLALAQAEMVRARLAAAWPELAERHAIAVEVIRTTGDRITDRPLAEAGGKGLFTKEIEEALIAGRVDLAVHSMKDLPTVIPDGLVVPCLLQREDPRDALIGKVARVADLPRGAVIGTSSLRRKAQLLARRRDLVIRDFRGNVDTRLRKLEHGDVQATILALAGLRRLGLEQRAAAVLDAGEMLPAVAQGAIGIEIRAEDGRMRDFLKPLHHTATGFAVAAERGVLEVLDGSCRTPIAALASGRTFGRLRLDALVAKPDGSKVIRTAREGPETDAAEMGRDAGEELRRDAGPGFFG